MNSTESRARALVEDMATLQLPGCFNPWSDTDPLDAVDDAPQLRRDLLMRHLSIEDPVLILVGEAPGYRGCRFAGVNFSSEQLILDGAIPRIPLEQLPGRITSRPIPWKEPSASIVWGVLYRLGVAERTILWNACPLHPMPPGKRLGNRKPTAGETAAGERYLARLLQIFPRAKVVAVGRTSEGLLGEMGVTHTGVRHPAYGGKAEFTAGLSAVIGRC